MAPSWDLSLASFVIRKDSWYGIVRCNGHWVGKLRALCREIACSMRETYLIGWPKRVGERREAKATTTEWGDTFGHFRFGQLYFR